jgi:hypothetical protein
VPDKPEQGQHALEIAGGRQLASRLAAVIERNRTVQRAVKLGGSEALWSFESITGSRRDSNAAFGHVRTVKGHCQGRRMYADPRYKRSGADRAATPRSLEMRLSIVQCGFQR